MRSQFQMLGFYLAGFLCLALAILKLTIQGQWSWWRLLLPLWVLMDHNALYIVIGFVWLSYADDGEAEGTSTPARTLTKCSRWCALSSSPIICWDESRELG